MRIKRSLKKGMNVITAVGCIIYAAFQGGRGKKGSQIFSDLQIFEFSEAASRSQQHQAKLRERIFKMDG